jgi:hypothetical protein
VLLFFLLLCGSALTVRRHLRFDLHPAVELVFGDTALALRIAFFFDGIKNATELGEPLGLMKC